MTTLDPTKWALFHFAVSDDMYELVITMERTEPVGDPDLYATHRKNWHAIAVSESHHCCCFRLGCALARYVRRGTWPDRTHYDIADFSTTPMHSAVVTRPDLVTGDYYAGVYAYGEVPIKAPTPRLAARLSRRWGAATHTPGRW